MPPSLRERLHLSRVAQGLEKADLLILGGKIVNVYSREIIPADMGIARGRIAYVRPGGSPPGPAAEIISAEKYILSPGYIEPHGHPWVVYNPLSLCEAALPLGTTTLIMDDLPFFQHAGPLAVINMIKALQERSSFLPRLYWSARAVPQSPLYGEEELFSTENVEELLSLPEVISIAEITRWNDLLGGRPSLLAKLRLAEKKGKKIDGHTAGCKHDALNALSALGISSCHEPITTREVLERLRLGLWVMLRQSSLRPDMETMLPELLQADISLDRFMMTTDAPEPVFVHKNGLIDGLVKIALQNNMGLAAAVKLATLNPAVFYALDDDIGGLAPGRYADILFLKDVEDPVPETVLLGGRQVAVHGNICRKNAPIDWVELGFAMNFHRPSWLDHCALLAPPEGMVPVIKLVSSGISKGDFYAWDGKHLPEGMLYCCLLGRGGDFLVSCLLDGFAHRIDGLACSFTTSMGVLLVGRSLEAMSKAAGSLFELQGGIVLREGDVNIFELSLPICGMMSSLPLHQVAPLLETFYNLLGQRGFRYNDPLLSLLFLSCDFLPTVRITPLGVLDVKKREIIYPPKIGTR